MASRWIPRYALGGRNGYRCRRPVTPGEGRVGRMSVEFSTWIDDRTIHTMSTNSGAEKLAFQKWRHFKESFTPELVARAIRESPSPVSRCVDPFGGSGTTALACQFLGVKPITVEVNPYLADLIEAKLAVYDTDLLAADLGRVLRRSRRLAKEAALVPPIEAPRTLVHPGVSGRWVFDSAVARRLGALLGAVASVDNPSRRLFRVLVGGILIDVSNVVVNGKGRRYRKNWQTRPRKAADVEELFTAAAKEAIQDIHRFADRACLEYTLLRGDAREETKNVEPCELAVFSPPYPNSFDYTDVYNLELWMLGYLKDRHGNRHLRQATLSSHVQIQRSYPPAPRGSATLRSTIESLQKARPKLWNRRIPDMVGGYFSDLASVLLSLGTALGTSGQVWLVVGDSRYSGVSIPVAGILEELAPDLGYRVVNIEPFRSMRASAQQGGMKELAESLLVLERA